MDIKILLLPLIVVSCSPVYAHEVEDVKSYTPEAIYFDCVRAIKTLSPRALKDLSWCNEQYNRLVRERGVGK